MKIYLAHNFEARDYLRDLVSEGIFGEHSIVCSWIYNGPHSDGSNRLLSAVNDVEDVDSADCLVLFIDGFQGKGGKGKWFEFGYAFAKQKMIFLIGEDKSCVFTHLESKRIYWLKEFGLVALQEKLKEIEVHLYTGVRKDE